MAKIYKFPMYDFTKPQPKLRGKVLVDASLLEHIAVRLTVLHYEPLAQKLLSNMEDPLTPVKKQPTTFKCWREGHQFESKSDFMKDGKLWTKTVAESHCRRCGRENPTFFYREKK